MRLEKRIFSMFLCLALVLSGMVIPVKEVQAEEVKEAEIYIEESQTLPESTPGLGAEYKLTLIDSDITIASSGVKRVGNTVTIPYSVGGANMGNVTRVSLMILDKEYTAGNTNGATILAYEKLNEGDFAASGTGVYTIPDSFVGKTPGVDYHVYLIAEDRNGENGSDYASAPLEIPIWAAPAAKQICIGTQGIVDPAVPGSEKDNWNGCYVYYGAYDTDGDQVAEPVKYRVLDASTTKFGAETMFLDCDSILFQCVFAGSSGEKWANSDIKQTLNDDGGLIGTAFTDAEQNAIAASIVESHVLTTDSETGVNVSSNIESTFKNYVALGGEKLFLLDVEDVCNGAYGYGMNGNPSRNRMKTGASTGAWWLRSVDSWNKAKVGVVLQEGGIYTGNADNTSGYNAGVSPAMNLDLSSILFSSVSGVDKTSALTSESNGIGMTTDTQWKLTLSDADKTITLTPGRSAVKAGDGTITVPYTYTDNAASEHEKVNQISVMITDKTYGSENAQILYYGALQNIKNAEGTDAAVAEATTGTGTFALPSGLTGIWGTDYHVYILAERVNADNFTDYASSPLEISIKTQVTAVNIAGINAPVTGLPLTTETEVSGKGVVSKAPVTWKKGETAATGNAEANTSYRVFVTLTAQEGYTFADATGAVESIAVGGKNVASGSVTQNADGTVTVACGEYKTADDIAANDSQVSVNPDGTVTYVAPTDKNATTVTIPTTVTVGGVVRKVTAIEANAFKNSNITSITIGDNITTIGANAFYGCKKLKTVKLGKNVTTIGAKAFYKCTALKKITIPSKVKSIGKQAFYGCSKLKTLIIKTTKLTKKRVGSKAFGKTSKKIKVTMPKKKFKTYKTMLIKKGVNKKAKFKKK
ncbi:MAG: leucine-rich repeat protein [Lachnospiraceae bacterium]|nr:leucine-rich repeat protein [Lachnospiraceae bacterium]